jgi:CubicO group peptidase (beta-lactamase class C family)
MLVGPRRALALFALALPLCGSTAALAAPKRADAGMDSRLNSTARFDALVERGRADWNVPGLAVAVVRDGKVLLAKGYGVRELGKPGAVDADTLFAAASTTKAMTAAAIGMLVDDGKLGWDDPVRRFVPELELHDAELADSLTVRDLLTHHTGLPATDYLWYSFDGDWKSILGRLKRVARTASTRSRFEYQNVMYGLAGDVVGRVAGTPWAEVVRERIFRPLGMSRSVPLGAEAARQANVVTPHSREDGAFANWDTLAVVDPIPAAGSVWTSANDMAKWISFLLSPETARRADGTPLLKAETVAELFRPQVVIQPGGFYPTVEKTQPKWTTYGLGWFQHDYRGAHGMRRVDFHTGSIDGLVAIVGLARDERFGVVVLGNLDHAEVRHALMYSAFDLFLDGELSRDWNGELRALYGDLRKKAETARSELEAKRVSGAKPSRALADFAGVYEDPLYGTIRFELDGEALRARVGALLAGRAEPWHFDTFRVAWDRKLYGVSWATFRLGADGAVSAVDLDGTLFARKPADKADAPTPSGR